MRSSLDVLCHVFISSRDMIKSAFGWESSYMYPISAAIFTEKRQQPDIGRMKECERLLKRSTGTFFKLPRDAQTPDGVDVGGFARPGGEAAPGFAGIQPVKGIFLGFALSAGRVDGHCRFGFAGAVRGNGSPHPAYL